MIRQEEIALPAQQSSPQTSALDQSLLTELGSVAMESDIDSWNPQDNVDSRAMVAGIGGHSAAVLDALKAARARNAARIATAEQDVLRVGEAAPSSLDQELGAIADQKAPPVRAIGESLEGMDKGASQETAPVAPSPEAAAVPETPQGDANIAADIKNMNPFARSVNDPTSLGSVPTTPEQLLASMNHPNPVMERLGGSGLNAKHIDNPESKQLADTLMRLSNQTKDYPEKKVVPHAQAKRDAHLRSTIERNMNMKVDQKLESKDLTFLYETSLGQLDELKAIGARVDEIKSAGGQPDGELLAAYMVRANQYVATTKTLEGGLTDAARSLNIARSFGQAGSSKEYYRMIANAIEAGGGADTIIERARLFKDGVTPKQAKSIIAPSLWDKTVAGAYFVRYNMMLGSVRSMVSNFSMPQTMGLLELLTVQPAAAAFNVAEYIAREVVPFLPKMKPEERIHYFDEMPVQIAGMWQGAVEGISLVKQIATGKAVPVDGKFMNELGIKYDPVAGQDGAFKKYVVGYPTLINETADAFNKTVFYRQKLNQLALRQSTSQLDPEKAYDELVTNPPDWMRDEAIEFAKRLTLSNDPSYYGKVIGGLSKSLSYMQHNLIGFKVLVPFNRTPMNSLGRAMQGVGLGQALDGMAALIDPKGTYKVMMEGTPAARAEYAGRLAVAGGLWALCLPLWQAGKLTGSNSVNPDLRRAYETAGWQENSVVLGDGEHLQLSRLDPLGLQLLIISSALDAVHQEGVSDKFNIFMAAMLAVAQVSQDRSSLSGIDDFMKIMSTDKGSTLKMAESFVAATSASFVVHGGLRDVREMVDPYQRDMAFDGSRFGEGVLARFQKYVMNATPVLSGMLPPSLDANGDYIKRGGNFLWRGLVPIRISDVKGTDPVAAMYLYHRTPIRAPDYLINIRGTPIQFNTLAMDDGKGWVYHEYQKQVGKARHELMMDFLDSNEWKKLAESGDYGIGSTTELAINQILSDGLQLGQANFLEMLSETDMYVPNINGVVTGDPIQLVTNFRKEDLKIVAKALRKDATELQKIRAEAIMSSGVYQTRKKKSPIGLPHAQQQLLDQATGNVIPEQTAQSAPKF